MKIDIEYLNWGGGVIVFNILIIEWIINVWIVINELMQLFF